MTLIDETTGEHPVPFFNIQPRRINTGLYDQCGFDLYNCLPKKYEQFFSIEHNKLTFSYGVCDSIGQFINDHKEFLENHKDNFIVGFTLVKKSDQSPEGGWRWHKWGHNIGKQKPTTEYLYDEPTIKETVVFHIYRRKCEGEE